MDKLIESTTPVDAAVASVSRRTMLGRAAGAAAGAVGATLLAAAPAAATNGDALTAGSVTLAEGTTGVKYDGADGFTGIVLFGNDSNYSASTSFYPAAVGGWAGAGHTGGSATVTTGVYGYTDAASGHGVVGLTGGFGDGSGGAGVLGIGSAEGTYGVHASSSAGVALLVEGRATFSRSGRVSVRKGKKTVDVTVPGGLQSSSKILATLQQYRSGVWVTACRRNYPTAGTMRIYLNKVASSTRSTAVAWFVLD